VKKGKTKRILIAVVSILLAVSVGAYAGMDAYKSLLVSYLGGSLLKNTDIRNPEILTPYPTNGMSLTEWKAEADKLVEEIAAEGVTLLKNENNTLPLAKGAKVSLFGRSSVDLVYGGTGAGTIDVTTAVNLKQGLEAEGRFQVNNVLWDFYKTFDGQTGYIRSNGGFMGARADQIFTAEVAQDLYTDEVKASYDEYSDAAIVVLSRVGGEGSDMPASDFGDGTKYLQLQDVEKELLQAVKDSGKFEKIIVLVNSSNAMELGFLDQETYGISAALWLGGVGQSGARAIGSILAGDVNPSGHLPDTYAADSYSSPAMQNFGDFTFTNAEEINAAIGQRNNGTKYVVYQEGIYVGYRYYETRYADSVTDPEGTGATSSAGAFMGDSWNYADEVVYPFGHGLSYGTDDGLPFMQTLTEANMIDDGLTATIHVINNGTVAGKSVVQLYAQQPYEKGGIEKSAVQLVAFGKTKVLNPGESEDVTLTVRKQDFASYDYKAEKTYVLDAGTYYFAIGDNAHSAVNNILGFQGFTEENGVDGAIAENTVYTWENKSLVRLATTENGTEITNQLDNASLEYYSIDSKEMTRADWTTFPTSYTELTATADMMHDIDAAGNYVAGTGNVSFKTGVESGITFASMRGLDYDDPKWEAFLDQMKVEDLVRVSTQSALSTIPSISYPAMFMKDGPQGNNTRSYVEDGSRATGYCGAALRAATFNKELMRQVGEAMGEDWLRTDTEGAYTPAVNIHRTPYAGRNFEYYSEDGLLTGLLAAEEVKGLQSKGAISYIKHFALNDQETNRQGVSTFANEQVIREVYLKAFEFAFTDGEAKGTMGSFNRIGCTWSGANAGLIQGILRGEWNSKAIVDTDMAVNTTIQAVEAGLEAGNNMWATSGSNFYNYLIEKVPQDTKAMENLRESSHIILYQVANSSGTNNMSVTMQIKEDLPFWEKYVIAGAFVLGAIDLVLICWMLVSENKKKKGAA